MKDCHIHTNISHDGISTMQDYFRYSLQKGVDEITFTEHYDIYDGVNTELKTIDVDEYQRIYYENKDDSYLKSNFGIEIGLRPEVYDRISDMVESHDFDFIIGSSHIICNKDVSIDKSFFDGYTRWEAYMRYFEEVLTNIKLYDNEFDVYGHLDYIVRYGGYEEKQIKYREYKDILDEILINLIKKDKGIEVNTSGIRYGLGTTHPNLEILKRYKKLGGKIVTVGSDALRVGDLCSFYNIALDMLECAGFDKTCVYHNRQPEFYDIKSLRKNIKPRRL